MTKLAFRLFILGTAVIVSHLLLFWGLPRSNAGYLAARLDKLELLRTTASPKIVFVGGSNLAFGLDSAQIAREFGMPVVNMGLHAGLGLYYMVNDVEPYIGPGDIVVISPEYQQFFTPTGEDMLWQSVFQSPDSLRRVRFSGTQVLALLQAHPGQLLTQLYVAWVTSQGMGSSCRDLYCRDGFDEYGDFVGHLNLPSTLSPEEIRRIVRRPVGEETASVVEFLNEFSARIAAKDAVTYLVYPAIPEEVYALSEENITLLAAYLASHLEIPILSSPARHVLPFDDFFNTIYHLTATGRDIRTTRLIEDLHTVLPAVGKLSTAN